MSANNEFLMYLMQVWRQADFTDSKIKLTTNIPEIGVVEVDLQFRLKEAADEANSNE